MMLLPLQVHYLRIRALGRNRTRTEYGSVFTGTDPYRT
jgi:hypothetical protein